MINVCFYKGSKDSSSKLLPIKGKIKTIKRKEKNNIPNVNELRFNLVGH